MNDSSIIINGGTKIMIGVIAYFIIDAARDIICKWLDNRVEEITNNKQNVEINKYECSCSCKCKCKNIEKINVDEPSEPITEVCNPIVEPATMKIIDNYSKNQKHK